MKDKFKGNFWIALPAAIATLVLILLLTMGHDTAPIDEATISFRFSPTFWFWREALPGSTCLSFC